MNKKILFIIFLPLFSAARMPAPKIDLSKYTNRCKQEVLAKMGWQVKTGETNQISSPEICNLNKNEVLSAILKIEMKSGSSTALDQAINSAGTNCVYQNQLGLAVKTATQKLKRNKFYIFSPFWQDDLLRIGGLKKAWKKVACTDEDNQCFIPASEDKAKSIDALYESHFSSDCSVGLQLAEYAMIKELMGTEHFNTYFSNEEIFLGLFPDSSQSKSFTRGLNENAVWAEEGLKYAESGFQSFIGVSGAIKSVFDEKFLDDIPNVNENFMIVESTQAAAQAFIKKGGLAGYEKELRKIWELTRTVTKVELHALQDVAEMNYLVQANEIFVQGKMPPDGSQTISATTVQILNLLKDPFLSETQLYVHPVGQRSIAWHILRLAQINPRTPYKVDFYHEVIHGELYNRWMKSNLDDCKN